MLDVSTGSLGKMAVDIPDDLGHVLLVGLGEFGLFLAEDVDDSSPRRMPGGFTTVLVLPRLFGLIRFQPFGQLARRHVDGRAEFILRFVAHALTMLRKYPGREPSKRFSSTSTKSWPDWP